MGGVEGRSRRCSRLVEVGAVWVVLGIAWRVVMVHHWPRTRIGWVLLRRLLLVVMEVCLNRLIVPVLLVRRFLNLGSVDPEHNVDAIIQRRPLRRISPFGTFQNHIFRTVESIRLGVHVIVRGTLAETSRRRFPLLTLQLGIANRRIRQALLVPRNRTLVVRLPNSTTGNHVDLVLPWRFLLWRRRTLIKR